MSHPTPWEFHPVHHPSYIDFFEEVLAETTDPLEIEAKYEEQFATDPWYIHLYRTTHAYHGVHPFYMWYWGAHALQHLGGVIVVGGDTRAVRRLGFKPASTLARRAGDGRGRRRAPPDDHAPAYAAADDRRRHVKLRMRAFPFRAPTWPGGVEPGRRSNARPASTSTPSGLGATRCGSPGPMVLDGVTGPVDPRPGRAAHRRPRPLRPASRAPAIFAANHASHVDTAAPAHVAPGAVPPPHDRGRRRRLLLRHAMEGRGVGVRAERHSHRAHQGVAAVGRPPGRPDRRRVVRDHLSRGWPQSPDGWAPGVPGRRRLPVDPLRRAGRARPHRGHAADPARGGAKSIRPSTTTVTFGAPMRPEDGEDARRFGARIETRSRRWPTSRPPTGGRARQRAPAASHRRSPAQPPAPGGAPGPSARTAAAPAPTKPPGPSSKVDDVRWCRTSVGGRRGRRGGRARSRRRRAHRGGGR